MTEMYHRGMRWEQPTERPFEIAVDPPTLFTVGWLHETHIQVREMDAPDLGTVFNQMQVDRWPEREIVAFGEEIDAKGLTHSSMCPGDIAEDTAAGRFYECDLFGWRELAQDTPPDE